MRENTNGKLSNHLRRAAMAMIASGIVVLPTVHANPSSNIVVVPPADLPGLARQPFDEMFLRDAIDGRTFLYVEQNHGAKLAVFDVTDPRHVKSDGSVQLGTHGPFDFVSSLGGEKELVRFRQDQGEAVLDFHRVSSPSLKQLPGLDSPRQLTLLGNVNSAVIDSARGVAYVADGAGSVDIYSLAQQSFVGSIPVQGKPSVVTLSTDRTTLYAGLFDVGSIVFTVSGQAVPNPKATDRSRCETIRCSTPRLHGIPFLSLR
jgi:hypothetical protein